MKRKKDKSENLDGKEQQVHPLPGAVANTSSNHWVIDSWAMERVINTPTQTRETNKLISGYAPGSAWYSANLFTFRLMSQMTCWVWTSTHT